MTRGSKRMACALAGLPADRRPCICPGGMMNMVTTDVEREAGVFLPDAHSDAEQMARLSMAVWKAGCFDNCGVPFCMTVEAEGMGAKVDMGSQAIEPHVVGYAIEFSAQWAKLRPLDVGTGRARVTVDAIRILRAELPDVPVIGNVCGPVSTATSLMEPTTFYKELRRCPDEAHALLDFVTNQLQAFALAQVEAGASIIALSDPSGTGEILGPARFDEFVVPYINRVVDAVNAAGAGTIVHICGHMKPVYSEASALRSDALSFDAVVALDEAKKQLPEHLLMGNVSTYALEFSNPSKVASLTRNCVKRGADIVAPACGLGMCSPLENVQAMKVALEEDADERGEDGA